MSWYVLTCARCGEQRACEGSTGDSVAGSVHCSVLFRWALQRTPPAHLHIVGLEALWCWGNPCEVA